MATKKTKTTRTSKKGKTAKTTKKRRQMERREYEIKVTRAFEGKYGTLFDMELNHVKVYGCRVCETRDGEPFVGWPQKQGKDGNYYAHAWAYLEEDQTAEIMDQIAALLAEEDEDEEEEEE